MRPGARFNWDEPWLRLTLLALVLGFAAATGARAELTLTKSHVDENGGQLCEGDFVTFTIHVECTLVSENFRLTDVIASSYWSYWELVSPKPPFPAPLVNCSTNVGNLVTPGPNGNYCVNGIAMNPGDATDFVYRAKVRKNDANPQKCQAAAARDDNLGQYSSNDDCVVYDCVVAGQPNVITTKTYTGTPNPQSGDPVSWRIDVLNSGAVPDSAVNVKDVPDATRIVDWTWTKFSRAPDAGANPPANSNLDATWNTIAAGETLSFELHGTYVNCTPGLQDAVCNQATITSTAIKTLEADGVRLSHPPGGGEVATCVAATPGGSAQLTTPVAKTVARVPPGPVILPGDTIQYTVTFENNGWCATSLGSFKDDLPIVPNGGVTLDLASVDSGGVGVNKSSGNQVLIDQLAVPRRSQAGPGTVTIKFQAKVVATSGQVCNTGNYIFGVGNPTDTSQACFTVNAAPPPNIAAVKSLVVPNGPNGDGTLNRGQSFQYRVHITNTNGGQAANDVAVTDDHSMAGLLDPGLDLVSLDQNPGGNVILNPPAGLQLQQIAVPINAGNIDLVFTVKENGIAAANSQVCNVAQYSSGGVTKLTAPAVCLTVVDNPQSCPVKPAAIAPLLGIRSAGMATFSWPQENNSAKGYRLYSVILKTDIATADASNPQATLQCNTNAVNLLTCDDPNAIGDPNRLLHYQLVGLCGDGATEGAH